MLSSHKTAIFIFFPLPFGKLTTVLKPISSFLCFKFKLNEASIDSSNFVVQLFCLLFFNSTLLKFQCLSYLWIVQLSFLNLFENFLLHYSLTSIPMDRADPQIILVACFINIVCIQIFHFFFSYLFCLFFSN